MCYSKTKTDVNDQIFNSFMDKLWRDIYSQVEQRKWAQMSSQPKETVRECCIHILLHINRKLDTYDYRK